MGPDLGSSLVASSTIPFEKILPKINFLVGADGFFMADILYPRLQWIMHLNQDGGFRKVLLDSLKYIIYKE